MKHILTLFVLVILSLVSYDADAQESNQLIYHFKTYHSKEHMNKTLAGVVMIENDTLVKTYVYDFGYINWKVEKHDHKDEYFLATKAGDKCYMKVIGDKIFLHYKFVFKEATANEHIMLTYRLLTQNGLPIARL